MNSGWFITGTDTGVGKTRAAQALLESAARVGRRAVGMKPVAAGCRATPVGLRSDDAEALIRGASVSVSYDDVNPYAFAPAISPHLAAAEAGVAIRLKTILACYRRLAALADVVVVEGAGGWLAPIGATHTMADVARTLDLPVILVVGMRLGCLNHALLTAAAIAQSGAALAGWIANCIDPASERLDDNIAALESRLRAPRLVTLPFAPRDAAPAPLDALCVWLGKSD
jgi:dethiobiotin synthetase